MPTECERSVTSSVTTKISSSNEIKDNNSTITTTTQTTTTSSSSSISFNEDLQTSTSTMMEGGGDMSTSQTSTTSNGSSSCNGGGRKTSITSPDPTAYVAKARVTRPTPPPPPYNPMQFVQIKPCNLYQTAQEQLKKAEEVKKIKEIRKEEPEDWQNNLDNWKSSRRKRVEHIIDRVVEVKKLELEEHDRTRRKSKTFSEMIEERGERAGGRGLNKLVSLAVYAEDESNDLSDLGIGTSSASGKSSLSEDYDNNSVMSDNAAELDKAITNSTHHKPATDSTTREYISSPGYETSSSTAPASSPDPCEYTYEGAIQDYKQRVSRAASGLTAVALNKLTQHNQTQQNSKESTPERGVVKETTTVVGAAAAAAYPPRRGSKIEDRLMGFEVQSPSSEECVEKSKVDVPKIDISKRKEIFEQQQLQQQQQQALQTNEPKSSQLLGHQTNTTVVVPRVTLRDRFKVQQQQATRTETSVTEQPKKELKRLSGDITSIKERLQSLEQQQNLVNGGANGATKATANKLVDIPVPPLKERLSSLQNAVTKEEIRKPPVVLIDARQLEIMKVEEEKAQQTLKETKEKEKEKEKQPETATTTQQVQKETNKIVTEEPEETDRDDSGIHTADDVELEEQQQQQRLQADQMMKKEQELKLNAAIEALAKEEQQLSEAANVVNQIEAEFEELTLASVATLPPLAAAAVNNTTAASSSSASASATPITNDHMEYSINEALELALAAIDKETIPLTAAIQQQLPPPPPQQLQPQPENLYPITAPSSNTYDNNNSSSSTTTTTNNNNNSNNNNNNINNICNNNNKKNNNNNKQQVVSTEDILLNKTDEEKYEKLNLEIKLEEKSEEEISQEPIYENIITTNNSTASIKEVDVALMMSTTTTTTTTTATTVAYQQQQQQSQIIPSMIMMMHNTDDHNNTDQHNNNNNNDVDNDNKSSPNNNHNNHNHNNIIKPLKIENQNSNQNLSTLTSAASATAVTVSTTALASKQLKNSQINKINKNNNNSNNNSNIINNIVVANDNNYNHHNNNNTDNKIFNKQNLDDLTNAFANTTITTTTTTNNATTTQQHISTTTTTTVNHKPNNNTNTNSCSSSSNTTTSSSTIHLKELNFNQQTPLMMTTAAVQQQQPQPSDLNKPEQQQQHLQHQQQQHLIDDNNSEPYYQVPKSNEPYYDAPKHLKPIPVYENIEVFFNGNSLSSTDLNSHLQPPKEKPPPPPIDSPPLFDDVDSSSHTDTWSSDNTYETLTRHQSTNHNHHHHHHLSPDQPSPPIKRMNSTKRIKKELRHKRSSFLGIEGSSLDDDESYLELTVAPPPDMAQLLQEERRLEKQLYLKAGLCDSSDTGESRDSGVSENHSRQNSEHYTNSSEENEPHDDTTSPLTLQTQTDTQPNDMIYQNDGLLAVVPTPLLQTVKGNSAESWTESATVAAAATQSLTEATATANAKMMSIEEKIREQEEVLRVERELLQLEQEELKRQRENLMLRENMARRELQHGAKMLMSANRRSLQDLNGLGAMTVVNIQNESQIPANGLEMYHHQMHPGLQAAQGQQHMMSSQPQLAQPQQLQQQANKPQQIYANIPNLQQQYYHMETDYRKSMSDINEFSKRMMSQPPAPPSKPMRAMHTNTTSNANGGVIHNVEQNDYAARQRHSLNTQNFGGSLVKIAAAPTAAPRTAAHIYSNYQHQSVQNLAPTSTSHQQVLTTANQSLYPGNMSRNTLHALSATPKPKYTDGWIQVQQRKSYDSNLANDPAWLSAYQQKRKSMPDANYQGYNQNNHWLIQEAEQRRLNEQQQQQQQQQQRRTISSNNTPLHQMNNSSSSNSIKMTNGSSTVLSTAIATTNGKPLPDSIIQTLTERVQSKGIGERKRTNLDKSPLHAASTYHHYQQQQQQQQQQYNKLNQTQQQFSSNTAIHRHNNIITTLSSTATASTAATFSMAATTANGQSNITTITQQQQQQQHQQDKVLSVSGKKKCSHCGDELGRGAAMIIESLLLFYHINCFKCCVCHVQLGDGLNGTDVRVRNHKLHCQNCYSSDDGIKFSCV